MSESIDMRAICRLAEGDQLGDRFIAEIIDVFLADLSERVRTIGLQVSHDDRAGIAATAHAVRGSCGHFGALRLMASCREIEYRVRHQQTDGLQTAIDSMLSEAQLVRAALKAYRSSL
jgi:HPt (histidine-containing phosphotransfer) domain-containing protein